MAKQQKDRNPKKRVKRDEALSLDPINYKIIVIGVGVIILGYIALSMGPWDGFYPLILAPLLLVCGYCVIIPFGIMYRKKVVTPATELTDAAVSSNPH